MLEIGLVIAIVLGAVIGLFRSFHRDPAGSKEMCSCGHGCPCSDSGCTGNDLFGNSDRSGTAFDEASSSRQSWKEQ
jgi:hypothetical protein